MQVPMRLPENLLVSVLRSYMMHLLKQRKGFLAVCTWLRCMLRAPKLRQSTH